jgi:hypothetical protein
VPDDIIRSFVSRLAAYTTPEEVQRVEIELRQQWGGAEVYVCKAPSLPKAARLGAGLASGLTLREAFDSAGVSYRHGYRLLRLRAR